MCVTPSLLSAWPKVSCIENEDESQHQPKGVARKWIHSKGCAVEVKRHKSTVKAPWKDTGSRETYTQLQREGQAVSLSLLLPCHQGWHWQIKLSADGTHLPRSPHGSKSHGDNRESHKSPVNPGSQLQRSVSLMILQLPWRQYDDGSWHNVNEQKSPEKVNKVRSVTYNLLLLGNWYSCKLDPVNFLYTGTLVSYGTLTPSKCSWRGIHWTDYTKS